MQKLNKPQIVLALDVDTPERARYFVTLLAGKIKLFKIGSQLFTACGPEIVRMVGSSGGKVFLDLKFHDIPNTVYLATGTGTAISSVLVSPSGKEKTNAAIVWPVFMMTVHIQGGGKMLAAAAKGAAEKAKELNIERPLVVGVTRLTSDENNENTLGAVLAAAQLAKDSGLDGVVCSALEAAQVRKTCGADFIIVTPGIRSGKDPVNDQKRTSNPTQAMKAGSNFLVIGRPILEAKDPVTKTEELLGELNGAGN